MKIQKIRGNEIEFYPLMLESTDLRIGRMDVTEVAFIYAVFVENVDEFLHYKVSPDRWEMKKYCDGESVTAL